MTKKLAKKPEVNGRDKNKAEQTEKNACQAAEATLC